MGQGWVTDESPVRSVFWGTQRNEKLRLTAKKLLATCLLGGSQLPPPSQEGKVRMVQGDWGEGYRHDNLWQLLLITCQGFLDAVKALPGDRCVAEPVRETQREFCGFFPTYFP